MKADMRKRLAAASRKDRKARRQRQDAEEDVEQQLHTGENASVDTEQYLKVCLEFIERLRVIFSGKALRRTINSRDNTGTVLWSLPPYVDIVLRLRLSPREMAVIRQQASAASNKENQEVFGWREVNYNLICVLTLMILFPDILFGQSEDSVAHYLQRRQLYQPRASYSGTISCQPFNKVEYINCID
jgi:hypothetical protein